jgi:hypothetical protein
MDQEIVGSNPDTIYWMDVKAMLAITLKEKLELKEAKWGTPKINIKKIIPNVQYDTQVTNVQIKF